MTDEQHGATGAREPARTHDGRVAVITGASRGIGQAICVGLAQRGATVVGVDVLGLDETAAAVARVGGTWAGVEVDLCAPDAGDTVAAAATALAGRCDILINNAAIDDAVGWDDVDPETWQRILDVNLTAPYRLCKALVPVMQQNGWGRIVNVGSGILLSPRPHFVAYRASKMGLIGFSRALATEVGSNGITVNVMSPGVTRTAMVAASLPDGALEEAARGRPIDRVAVPEDLVGTAAFLTSDDAGFVTGQTILVNGGAAFV